MTLTEGAKSIRMLCGPTLRLSGGDDFETLANDQKVKAALAWFGHKPKRLLKP
jgi:hypothetical protein